MENDNIDHLMDLEHLSDAEWDAMMRARADARWDATVRAFVRDTEWNAEVVTRANAAHERHPGLSAAEVAAEDRVETDHRANL